MTIDQHSRALELCSYCAKLCRHACPVSNALGRETFVPQAKMHLLDMLHANTIGWTSDNADPLYACTGCGLCQQYCKHGNDVEAALWAGRREAVRRGVAPPAVAALPSRFRERNERLAAELRARARPEWLDQSARIAYLPGCDTVSSTLEDLEDAFTVFGALPNKPVRLLDTPVACVGYPLWAAGSDEAAQRFATTVVRQMRRYDTVVLGCAACTHLLRNTLPAQGLEPTTRVLHTSEFLAENAANLPIKRQRKAAYYHDPCYLGRHLGCYEAPRELVTRCVESPREFFHSRELAECCGGGGLVPLTHPDAATGQAERRLREPQLFGVDLVVTACASCKRTLRSAKAPVEVLDLVNLLAWSLG